MVVLIPAVFIKSFTVNGIPCRGDSSSEVETLESAFLASSRASSLQIVMKAFRVLWVCSARSRAANVTSSEDSSLLAMAADSSSAGMKARLSLSILMAFRMLEAVLILLLI